MICKNKTCGGSPGGRDPNLIEAENIAAAIASGDDFGTFDLSSAVSHARIAIPMGSGVRSLAAIRAAERVIQAHDRVREAFSQLVPRNSRLNSDPILDPILSSREAVLDLVVSLRTVRWFLENPDRCEGWISTPPGTWPAIYSIRRIVFDRVFQEGDPDHIERHADAVLEALGLSGLLDRMHALDHARRARKGEPSPYLAEAIDQQLLYAIGRLIPRAAASPLSPCECFFVRSVRTEGECHDQA